MKNFTAKFILPAFLSVILFSCGKEEYSPNQKFDKDSPRNINAANLDRLMNAAGDDTIRFVLSGDSQRAYDDLVPFVERVNSMPGVDFVIMDGDISDFGLLQEMKWVDQVLSGLKMPYLGVIGNHDHEANGIDVFKNMYGSLDYSFIYKKTKFVCHNTNSREYNFNGTVPDISWLAQQFSPQAGVEGYVGIAHVPAFSDDFDQSLRDEYGQILARSNNVYAVLNAHIDKTETTYPYEEGPPFVVTNSIYNRQFIVIDIYDHQLKTKTIFY